MEEQSETLLLWLILTAFVSVLVSAQTKSDPQALVVIHAGALIDGKSDKPLHNQVIVIAPIALEAI